MTIRKRLALWYSGLLTLLIIIFSVAVITVSRLTILNTVDNVLADAASDLVSQIVPVNVMEFEPSDDVRIFFQSNVLFNAPGVSIQVWRTHIDGEPIEPILVRSSNDIDGVESPLDENLLTATSTQFNSVNFDTEPLRVITRPFNDVQGNPLGVAQIASPMGTVVTANDQLLITTAIAAIISIAVSIGLGLWLSRHLLKPIEDITEAAASIANAEDLSTRLAWDGPNDELGQLTDVFNHTMERLEHLFSVQQRFIGDVSHELRTPLTTVLGNLELMVRYGYDESSMDAIHREAMRMKRMVDDLLLLTRADFGELDVDFYPVDLDTVALEVYEQALTLGKERDLSITLDNVEPVRLVGNADRIRQLMLNLIANAIKFTSDGGEVSISIRQAGDKAIIDVTDTGIGISEDDLKRIFDRFFQADSSRFHHSEADGAGLGLSIARWIVDIHGGTIDVHSVVGEGSRFVVTLPISGKQVEPDALPATPFKSVPLRIHSREHSKP